MWKGFLASAVLVSTILLQNHATAADGDALPQAVKDEIAVELLLTPEEISYIKQERQKRKEAAGRPVHDFKTVTRTVRVDLSPGAVSETIRVRERLGASLVFTDRTGAPWALQGQNNFARDFFETTIPVEGGAILNISAKVDFRQGNVAVFLKDLATPVMLRLDSTGTELDERVDFVLPRRGPGAGDEPTTGIAIPRFDPVLTDILAGLSPANSERLTVTMDEERSQPADITIWRVSGQLYMRSQYTLVSPGPKQYQASADGTKAYLLDLTPLVLVSDPVTGKFQKLKVTL